MEHYVYVYLDAEGKPFYVGKGKNKRAYSHLSKALKPRKGSYEQLSIVECRHLLKNGITPVIQFVQTNLSEEAALSLEIELIKKYGRRALGGLLVNQTDGGEGTSGIKQTKEHIESRASQLRGKKRSEESKAKMRGTRSPQTASQKLAAKKRANTVEARTRVSQQFKGKPLSAEQRQKISQSMKSRGHKPTPMLGENNPASKTGTGLMPDGSIATFKSLRTFCCEHGIGYSAARNTLHTGRPLARGPMAGFQLLTLSD